MTASKTVLVVDDAAEIRDLLADLILRPSGYHVLTAASGSAGLEVARAQAPDVVISDIKMPDLTGIELTQILKRERPNLPVILITAEGSEAVARQAFRAGAADYYPKPFDPDELLATLARVLAEPVAAPTQQSNEREALTRRIAELEALIGLGQAVAQLDLDRVLTRVVEAAVSLIGAEESTLLLLDPATGELTVRAAKNLDERTARTLRLRSEDSLAGQVVRTGEPVTVDENTPTKIVTAYLVKSLIYAPLRVRGRVIGVLGVDNRFKRAAFDAHALRLLQALSDEAAIAIENARLYTAVEHERTQLYTILNETEDGVIVIDHENRLILVNHTARSAFGVGDGDIVGRSIFEVIRDDDLRDLLERPKRQSDIRLPDGRTFNAHVTPITNIGRAVMLIDITHLKELDRIKADFVTTVSHDLRSPLTAVLGYVNLLDRVGPLTDQQTDFIQQIRISVKQMNTLISDLLDLGKIEAGFDTQKEPLDTNRLIERVMSDIRPQAEAKHQELNHRIPAPLPSLFGNPLRLRQMLSNLVENAIKYTPETGRIQVEAYAEGDFVVLSIADTGIGIPPADLPYVFDKFFRSDNASLSHEGTGLGLSIVKSIVENHGGRVWVNSQPGKGTTFTVMLPEHSTRLAARESRGA
ncbi:MAG TPA: ATP-binding protein [Anaerolineales bacterium]|nr:ATP-binding protein [Anaerolineales bacterium]HRF48327.1 ATP-binding protein [Anaerolineales bacterium]